MRILVISDTHVPTIAQRLPEKILEEAVSSDMIVHAGDLVSMSVLQKLSAIRQVHAVRGNMDLPEVAPNLPSSRIVTIGRWRIGIAHGHEGRGGETPLRALSVLPKGSVDCVVFGHSHMAMIAWREEVLLFNPGSPVAGRGELGNTYGVLEVGATLKPAIMPVKGPGSGQNFRSSPS